MQRIIVDMDEVIADVIPKLTDFYEAEFGRRPDPAEYYGRKIYDLPNAYHLRSRLHDVGFFADLPVMPHSQDVLAELNERYDIFMVTSATEFRNSLMDKWDWLAEHFPFIGWKKLVLCGDKSVVHGDYMIDDHVRNLEGFAGHGILYTASHNVEETRFARVNNWLEIRHFFKNEEDQLK